ncbi:glycosyl hydrolase family 61-domain-containing protein [Ilyonectria robusta]|uniref:glycosyl hydrolase family 61-domain-containing protein n=1 Tax=Ilyonectria robusta TaxID=1079257 RepID=UPI001E8E97FE|nr:glycosyl hydrolase family 61-domain-containing protein [Ilyonectria robusta]KAH8736022.1 glycosyl hydrolase family 61-domain-containing protein [Ilyonectria robusta]
MKFLATALGFATAASAHTLFTTFYVDGENQGDGTCVREPTDASKGNFPIYPLNGDAMACGSGGANAVDFVCAAKSGSQLTFEFRASPSYEEPGVIAEGHKGPCSVYIKKVDDMFSTPAAGSGWFKIWEDGYDVASDTWCTDTLRSNNGHLSVDLPTGLPSGYYLVRPEVLALHAAPEGDPQFYTSCAQIFIESGPSVELEIPEKYEVSIPGYISSDDAGVTFNIYETPLGEYPIPGPDVYIPTSESVSAKKTQTQKDGVIPDGCLAKNANWCGKALNTYSTQDGCWASSEACWKQADTCWASVPPSGYSGCTTWNNYCTKIDENCEAGNYDGLPDYDLSEVFADVAGPIPSPYGTFKTTPVTDSGSSDSGDDTSSSTTKAAATTSKAAATTAKADAEETSVAYEVPAATTTAKAVVTTDESSAEGTSVYVVPEEATSTYDASPEQTSESSGLKVSQDGRCGGETGQTCEGSSFGNCCSKKGKCGRKTRHCSCHCQSAFGLCD